MTKLRLGTLGLLAVALFSLPNCGGNSDTGTNNSIGGSAGLPTGGAGGVVGGGGVGTGGNSMSPTGGKPPTGGMPATGGRTPIGIGGSSIATGTGGMPATGGNPPTGGSKAAFTGGMPATGGKASLTGGMPATGGAEETGGSPPNTGGAPTGGASANGHQCVCALADSLDPPESVAGCTSNTPNDCTLEKAYCGQTCAGQATDAGQSTNCAVSCIANFASQAFTDLATYTSGSCTVTIRCP